MTQVVFRFKNPDLTPLVGKDFTVSLPRPARSAATGAIVVPYETTATTDANGEATLELIACDGLYAFKMEDVIDSCCEGEAMRPLVYRFYVPDSALPVEAEDLFIAPKPTPAPWDDFALNKLTQAVQDAYNWANFPEDTPFKNGEFSSYHWARKAQEIFDTIAAPRWGNFVGNLWDQVDLAEALNSKVDKVAGQGLSDQNFTLLEKTYLAQLPAELSASFDTKVDKVAGKQLSTNDYDDATKAYVDGLPDELAQKVGIVVGKDLSSNDFTDAYRSQLDQLDGNLDTKVDKVAGKGLSTEDFTPAYKAELDGLPAALAEKVDVQAGYGLSQENFTASEKSKLAALESSHYKGDFLSLAALQAAHPTAEPGDYANVDAGVGENVQRYIWDATDNAWVLQSGSVEPITAAQVKSLYESNPDTNAFGDSDKSKLDAIEPEATKNASDAALRDRSTHTGTQLANTISDLASSVRSTLLTGLSGVSRANVVATDSILAALGKLQARSVAALPRAAATDSVTDINTLTTEGWGPNLYGAAAGSRQNGHPDGQTAPAAGNGVANYYYILTLAFAANASQIAIPYLSGPDTAKATIKFRWLYGGTWTSWVSLPRSDSDSGITGGNLLDAEFYEGKRSTLASARPGFLPRDGLLLNRSEWADAWAFIQANCTVVDDADWLDTAQGLYGQFSNGDGSTTFRIPDWNGAMAGHVRRVPRGTDGDGGGLTADALQDFRISTIGRAVDRANPSYIYTATLNLTYNIGGANAPNVDAVIHQSLPASIPAGDSPLVPASARIASETRAASIDGIWLIRMATGAANTGDVDMLEVASNLAILANNSGGKFIKETVYDTPGSFTHTFDPTTATWEVEAWGAGAAGGASAGVGGQTTVNGTMVAGGGQPQSGGVGGLGGVSTGFQLNLQGGAGAGVDTGGFGAPGGSAPRGGSGGRAALSAAPGTNGGWPGGGGSSLGTSTGTGGAGSYGFSRLPKDATTAALVIGTGGVPSGTNNRGGHGGVIIREYSGGGPNVDLVAGLNSAITQIKAGMGQKVETIWSGSVGSAGVVLSLSSPMVAGDLIWLRHNDAQQTHSHPLVVTQAMLDTPGRLWYWSFAGGGASGLTFNNASQLTSSTFTAGYGLTTIYRSRAGL